MRAIKNRVASSAAEQLLRGSALVADDSHMSRSLFAAILKTAGYKVSLASDGKDALKLLRQGGIDILVLDINMPRLGGIDASIKWRKIEGEHRHLPIIGVTADATVNTERRCLDAGMDILLTKPVNAQTLLSTIERLRGGDTHANLADFPDDGVNTLATTFVPAIDQGQLSYLWSIGDTQFIKGMIDGFFEDIAHMIPLMRKSVKSEDVEEFRFCAHAFTGAASNMGARHLASLCANLEKITESEFVDYSVFFLKKIEHELKRVESELRSPEILKRPIVAT